MPQPSHIALELMINKLSELIEWIFQMRKKTESDKLVELNLTLKNQFDFSIFDVSENSFDALKFELEKIDAIILDDIIHSLFQVSISINKNQTFNRLKSNVKLNERIMEIILFTENRYNKLSLESSNIKNSIEHKIRLFAN